ncbi:MAG: DUF3107 domain-containing protein [Marmoricola sp.]
MEVRIGVQHASRELSFESRSTAEEVGKQVSEALSGGGVLQLEDSKGRVVMVPADKLAYVEIGSGVSGQVGFRG